VLTNESLYDTTKLFYDVDFLSSKTLPPNTLYFHAFWRRQARSKLGEDFLVLPSVQGSGRFLGMSVGLNTDSVYDKTWWGEGEVKMFMDGDSTYPTIAGTGAEDYIGSGWGLGAFSNLYQGAPVADEPNRQFVFYRWHLPDAIYFRQNLKVTLQQIGGGPLALLKSMQQKGVLLKAVTVDAPSGFIRLLERQDATDLSSDKLPDGWVNFYRVDDYSAVSYFYLDKPASNLPTLPAVANRLAGVQ
jgi:hypothetical protein